MLSLPMSVRCVGIYCEVSNNVCECVCDDVGNGFTCVVKMLVLVFIIFLMLNLSEHIVCNISLDRLVPRWSF